MCHFFDKIASLFRGLKKKTKGDKEHESKHIARLSPGYPEDDDCPEYGVYSDYLRNAFNDSNIQNIAITGNYGIGKSSFIKNWSNKKKYLFVSLCSFSKSHSKNLECDLLQQLLLGCGKVSKGNSYEQKGGIIKTTAAIICGVAISATIYFLTFFNIFKPVLEALTGPFPSKWENITKGIIYALFSIVMLASIFMVLFKLIKNYRLKKIAFKLNYTEIETERMNNIHVSYMERYRLDLICVLRRAAKKLDYTIVFEDMDRLDLKDCRYLFAELREINRLINLQASTQNPKKIMRFVYVIHDAVFCNENNSSNAQNRVIDKLLHLKFFDYIMPIVPSMLNKGALNYIADRFKGVGFSNEKFIHEIAPYLSDYRLINNITNEYVVLRDVYLEKKHSAGLQLEDEMSLMALVIYKVLLPSDYKGIREGKSAIFMPSCDSNRGIETSKAVECLKKNGWLSHKCFKFIGYDQNEIKKYIDKFFDKNACINEENNQIRRQLLREDFILCSEIIISKLNQKENLTECLSSVCYTMLEMALISMDANSCESFLSKITELNIKKRETLENFHENILTQIMKANCRGDGSSIQKLITVLRYLLKINHDNFDWFFADSNEYVEQSKLDNYRWKSICKFDQILIDNFIKKAGVRLAAWLNSFYNQASILREWRNHCSRETANALLQLSLNNEMRNWLRTILRN